jgi:hypothetical protein
VALILYGVFFWFGSRINQAKAKSWFVPPHFARPLNCDRVANVSADVVPQNAYSH